MGKMVKWAPPFRGEDVEMPDYELIRLERDGAIGRIVLNSPEKRNPLGYKRLLEIAMAAKQFELEDEIKVIIIKGDGPSFCSGYDISPVEPAPNLPENGYINLKRDMLWESYNNEHLRVFYTLWDLQKPVIAQIQGYCLAGGSELAAFCDIRVVAEDAQIGWPVGRHWSPGNIQYMPWMVGMTKAKFYMLTNQPMDGTEAFRSGWASAVVPAEDLEAETEKIARTVSLTDTQLAMLTKRSLNRQHEIMGFRTGIANGTDLLALAELRSSLTGASYYSSESEDEFASRAARDGLKAALTWRDQQYDMEYRTSDRAREGRDDTADSEAEATAKS
ncbi:enoyl-CoA hydratase/isomerase family protein [Rhodococcus erythropolis]|uniref:enoyl-CoA hydratase/isomerase family protein n=1 Tax=Rhodococcus erythropolis TaxID=1833 RepID=UPI0024B63F40|nr:enoyl-CoA hydratase/isomerase family protein [Rhodococcus erythropolis]MDJ0012201.1 enoyl-CoA hydratase/isomerase family protein [Rhodococcus erythropolis]MDJ0105264.1 enoyl-CoA hydratase/isomerase family protein [Rhodococcus erythropolis]